MRHPACDVCLWMSPLHEFLCDGTGYRCEHVAGGDRTPEYRYRSHKTCETCYEPMDQDGDICTECEARHPSPRFVKSYKERLAGSDVEDPPSVRDHLAAAEQVAPGITERLRDRITTHEELAAQRDAHKQLLEKPVADLHERLDEIRRIHRLPPLAQAKPIDPRDRTVAQVDVIRLRLHASLDAARQDNKMTGRSWPAHLHTSLVRELDLEYDSSLNDAEKGIVAAWSDHFLDARREKARND